MTPAPATAAPAPRFDPALAEDVLDACCTVTGLPAAHLVEFRLGSSIVRAVSTGTDRLGMTVGDVHPLEATLCQRMIDGRVGRVVADTDADPVARAPIAAAGAVARSYAGAPVRFPDGRLYGAVCCMGRAPAPELGALADAALSRLGSMLGRVLYSFHRDERIARERDELLLSVTHDLRTPLQALRFLGQDLVAGAVEAAPAGHQVDREAARVLSMIEDMMLVTRHRAGTALLQAQPVDLVPLVDEAVGVVGQACREAGHSIHVVGPGTPLVANVDANRVIRAVQNLLENACKYSPTPTEVRLTLQRDGSTALILVEDQGMGIEPADLPHVTARFFRSERAVEAGVTGNGLGLTTVQAVADLHEGTLDIASEPGAGSRFTLRLPLRQQGAVRPPR